MWFKVKTYLFPYRLYRWRVSPPTLEINAPITSATIEAATITADKIRRGSIRLSMVSKWHPPRLYQQLRRSPTDIGGRA